MAFRDCKSYRRTHRQKYRYVDATEYVLEPGDGVIAEFVFPGDRVYVYNDDVCKEKQTDLKCVRADTNFIFSVRTGMSTSHANTAGNLFSLVMLKKASIANQT